MYSTGIKNTKSMSIENFLANSSFLTLFLSMIFYWIEISSSPVETRSTKPPSGAPRVAPYGYGVGAAPAGGQGALRPRELPHTLGAPGGGLPYASNSVRVGDSVPPGVGDSVPPGVPPRDKPVGLNTSPSTNINLLQNAEGVSLVQGIQDFFKKVSFANLGMILSNGSLFFLLLLRWKESGHFPLSNLYESLMFLSWTLTTIHLFLNWSIVTEFPPVSPLGLKPAGPAGPMFPMYGVGLTPRGNRFTPKSELLGSITAPSALLTNAFATFSLPEEMQISSPLVPALQSNWLMMHVTVMILSYGALICGSLLSIAFLVITSGGNSISIETNDYSKMANPVTGYAQTLDNLSYRILGIGFPLLTIGILSGAVWANEAWGSYWSWDPKETWALLTWFVFAIYLHTRLNKGWQGKKPALIASLGFVSVWVCYLGVNLLGEGLHSYGWFSKI